MAERTVVVENVEQFAAARTEYLVAVEDGLDRLVIELRPPALGLDEPGLGGFELEVVGAMEPPPLDLVLRAGDGTCAIPLTRVALSARRVAVEGLALLGGDGAALRIRAAEAVELRALTVLGSSPHPMTRSAVQLMAGGREGLHVEVADSIIARSSAEVCMLGCGALSGAWIDDIRLEGSTIAGSGAQALVAVEAVRSLRANGCLLDASGLRVILGLGWPALEAVLEDCRLVPGTEGIAEYLQRTDDAAPVRVAGGSVVGASLAQIGSDATADDTVSSVAAEAVRGEAAAAVAAAVDRLVAIDERLAAYAG